MIPAVPAAPAHPRHFTALALAVAALAFAGAFWRGHADPGQFFRSYLFAFVFWLGLPLGAAVFALIHPLVGGAWGERLRPVLLSCVETLPLLALLFVPLAFGLRHLYPWMNQAVVTASPVVTHKLPYLNPTFFLVRAAIYFVLWTLVGTLLVRWTADYRPGAVAAPNRLRTLCVIGLMLLFVTDSLAGVDWVMSLERDYYSTVYGLIFIAGQGLLGLAFAIALTARLRRGAPDEPKSSRDLGSLLATSVLLWAYLQFSQLIVNWSGDTLQEISWYRHRSESGWGEVTGALIALNFAAPFFILLFRRVKDSRRALGLVAGALLVVHVIDVYWLVVPSLGGPARAHWLDGILWVALGSLWLGVIQLRLARRSQAVAHPAEATA